MHMVIIYTNNIIIIHIYMKLIYNLHEIISFNRVIIYLSMNVNSKSLISFSRTLNPSYLLTMIL